MAFDARAYPLTWPAIRAATLERAKNADGIPQCECTGECGLHRFTLGASISLERGADGRPGKHPRRCVELDGRPAKWAQGAIVLTTAHLCDCGTQCSNPDHLKAMCQRCHLRVDIRLHQQHRRERREAAAGQKRLL